MKLSRTIVYGVRSALQLAKANNVPTPCRRVATDCKLPERYVLQILRNMVKHGILQATRGVDGGYSLARPAASITLLDIVESVEGPVAGAPVEGADDAVREALKTALTKVSERTSEELSKVKLTDLLKSLNDNSY